MADQRRAGSIYRHYAALSSNPEELPGRGVTMCGWTQIAEQPSELLRVKDGEGYRAFFTGIQTCGLRWVCPCCTAKAAQDDRAYVNDGLAAAREKEERIADRGKEKLWPVMITLTTRHHKSEKAAVVLAAILRAEQKMKATKAWRRLSDRSAGYARVLEWTYGKHGHHPHFHTIKLIWAMTEEEAIAAAEDIQGAYMRQLEAAGRDGSSKAAWHHSFQVQGAAAAGSYVAKWGSAEELTGALAKSADGEGLTPWQLLRLARTAPDERDRQKYAAIWWEIVGATKGKAQLYKSEGWKELVEAFRQDDEGQEEPKREIVIHFGVREKRGLPTELWASARWRMLAIREAAESAVSLIEASILALDAIRNGPTDDEILHEDDSIELVEVDSS